ncbi:MAG: hypothetical protein IPK82_26055 [Polyangiaceae bacterium]|nr:hypothetical protein [Polyangiaceae bacterium]
MKLVSACRALLIASLLCSGCKGLDLEDIPKTTINCDEETPEKTLPEGLADVRAIAETDLAAEAEKMGVEIDASTIVYASSNRSTIVEAVAKEYHDLPNEALLKGVTVGFVYLDLPTGNNGVQPTIPAGYYRVEAQASQEVLDAAAKADTGEEPNFQGPDTRPLVDGLTVRLIGAANKLVVELPGSLAVSNKLGNSPGGAKSVAESRLGTNYVQFDVRRRDLFLCWLLFWSIAN